jgi:DNA polymerase-1
MFVSDEGKVFINVDLKQAEAMVMAYLAEETKLIELFNKGGDLHRLNASWIFNIPESEVTFEQRDRAKRGVHALDYGMGPLLFAHLFGCPLVEARRLSQKYFDNFPRIKSWHLQIQSALGKSRTITTPMGRKRTFFGLWGEQLFREAYAYVPQSTVADVLNLALIRFVELCTALRKDYEPMLQNHDAFLVQCDKDSIYDCITLIKQAFNIPIYIKGRTLTIPIDIKVGKNWDEMEKVK